MNITASAETLLDQAEKTARQFFRAAVREIDDEFGEGFAKNNPQIVAAFINAASSDFNVAMTLKVVEETMAELTRAVGDIGEAMRPVLMNVQADAKMRRPILAQRSLMPYVNSEEFSMAKPLRKASIFGVPYRL